MGLPAGTAGLKRHISITMEFASQTISPVPDISRYAESPRSRSDNSFLPGPLLELEGGGSVQ